MKEAEVNLYNSLTKQLFVETELNLGYVYSITS